MRRVLFTVIAAAGLTVAQSVAPNYGNDVEFPAVGKMGNPSGESTTTTGSGTAISPTWILTAFHVGGGHFEQDGVRHQILQRINHTDPSGNVDLALVRVRGPLRYAMPLTKRPWTGVGGLFGSPIWIVGFGMTGERIASGVTTVEGTQGTRRQAQNVIDARGTLSVDFGSGNVRASDYLVYDLDDPLGQSSVNTLGGAAVPGEGGQAGWDSGGAWFAEEDGRRRQVGVISVVGTLNGTGVTNWRNWGGIGAAVYVTTYRNWILSNVTDMGQAILNFASAEIGTRTAGTPESLFLADSEFVRFQSPNLLISDVFPLISARIRGVTTASPAQNVNVLVRGRVSVPLAPISIALRNVQQNRWEQVRVANLPNSYQNIEVSLTNAGKYVAADGTIEMRISVLDIESADATSVTLTLDQVRITAS